MNKLELAVALTMFAAFGCQFEDRCGKDDLVYARGLCSARDAGPAPMKDSGPPSEDPDEGGASESPCTGACDLIGRCIADNPMAAGFLAGQLPMLGFAGSDRSGCVSYCDDNRGGDGDTAVLDCMRQAEADAVCDQTNLMGSLPAVTATDACCKGRADSEYCVAVCTALSSNSAAYGLVPNCVGIAL